MKLKTRQPFFVICVLSALCCGQRTMAQQRANGTGSQQETSRYDVNEDGSVDVGDIMAIINYMAGMNTSYTTCPDGNHPHMIDLGLPSGTKWACCNVGAHSPEDYGGYFAWGETQTKNVYNWDTYQYGSSENDLVNIGSDIAGTGYDTATANWGAPWRMPTIAQCSELINNTTSVWTTQNGINGCKLIGTSGGTIFLPATGTRLDSDIYNAGSIGVYWLSWLGLGGDASACCLLFYSGGVDSGEVLHTGGSVRCYGHSVRPVRSN